MLNREFSSRPDSETLQDSETVVFRRAIGYKARVRPARLHSGKAATQLAGYEQEVFTTLQVDTRLRSIWFARPGVTLA